MVPRVLSCQLGVVVGGMGGDDTGRGAANNWGTPTCPAAILAAVVATELNAPGGGKEPRGVIAPAEV